MRPRSVSFRHDAPGDPSEHEAFFRCEVRFGAGYDGLEFDREAMATPMPGADPDLSRFLNEHLRVLAEGAPRMASCLEARVRQVLLRRLGKQAVVMGALARELGMSARTLRRRLREQGTSYHEILDGVRRDLAEQLLAEPDHKLVEIASLLGFSDASAFHRAYVRWTGRPPRGVLRAGA